MARLYIPNGDPALPVPADWRARERTDAPTTVIGPTVEFELLGSRQRAHLNYHTDLATICYCR